MTGIYRCPNCEYLYDERKGDPHEGFPPGTQWEKIPSDWSCPSCSVREKSDFVPCDDREARV
ncbi:MAG: rubredoxin [Nevskia sp.]|nr:rubredoxin [Nevskia sp.]